MDLSKYRCVRCRRTALAVLPESWECGHCGQTYSCVGAIPRLYLESRLGSKAKALRDHFYDGFVGKYYEHVMPFMALPARPWNCSWRGWLVDALIVAVIVGLAGGLIRSVAELSRGRWSVADSACVLIAIAIACWFCQHSYIFHLLLWAIPVKMSILWTRFEPEESFKDIHSRLINLLRQSPSKLRVLDVSTGTC